MHEHDGDPMQHQLRERQPTTATLAPVVRGAWSARGLLTSDEAEALRAEALERGMAQQDERLRDCTRATIECPELAARVFERLAPHLETEVNVDGGEDSRLMGLPAGDTELHGVWRPYGINPQFRVCKYPGDGRGHFGPHQDSAFERGPHDRSLLTVNGYLNALPEGAGGRTRFLVDDLPIFMDERGRFTLEDAASSVRGAIRPEAPGMAAVFYHQLMHDSEPLAVGAPSKWIWRTEVMYRRDPASVLLDPSSALARRIEKSAEFIERAEPMAAMALYKLAQRLRDGRIDVTAAQERFEVLRPADTSEGDGPL